MDENFAILEKYNFWHGEPVKYGLSREDYIAKLEKYLGNSLIKVLIGQRRAGKSYVMRQLIDVLITKKSVAPKNIFYLNKEMADFDFVQTREDLQSLIKLYQARLKVKGKIYILLDEVQEIIAWEKIVTSLAQDYKDQYELFITGSNSNLLSGELATYLSGRYVEFEILPFSYQEYLMMIGERRGRASYLDFLQTGGLPELFNLNGDETKSHYISSLYDTIILKDIVSRYKIRDIYLIEVVFRYLVDNISNLFSVNNIVKALKQHNPSVNFETVSSYVKYLLRSYLLFEAERYDIKGKAILGSAKKYYLNDLAFKNYVSSSFDYGLGKHLENAIYLHYRRAGYHIYVGKIGQREVDFIIERGDEKKYIQVAFSLVEEKTIDREYKSLESIPDHYEKLVISLDDFTLKNKDGVKHIQAWEL